MLKLRIVLILVLTPSIDNISFWRQEMADDDLSCLYTTEGDALPSAEDPDFSPPTGSIFFHKSSCQGTLNSRQACAIESAAKAHPGNNIYVLFNGPVTENILYYHRSILLELYSFYPNINFARVHVEEYTKTTAIEYIFTERTHRQNWEVVTNPGLLSCVTLFKFGGLYLDMDVIVVKPFYELGRNWIAKETYSRLNGAVLNLAKDALGQEFARMVLKEIGSAYKPDFFDHFIVPEAMYRVLAKFCNTTKVVEFSNCRGFQVYNPEPIYPLPWTLKMKLMETGDLQNVDQAYSIHFWDSDTHNQHLEIHSPLDKLAKQYCPIIRELYRDCFGN